MKRLMTIVLIFAATLLGLPPVSGFAQSGTEIYELVMFAPNMGRAPNGDEVAVLGNGTFQVNPKDVTASGTFTHTDSDGNVLGSGTWEATQLISYVSYGCGVVAFTDPDIILPPNFCGGALKLRVLLTTPVGVFDGILTVFCIIGPNPPTPHSTPTGEGVTLDVPGLINFNHTADGGNVFVRTFPP